jgi:hypothetical protein
MSKPGRFDKNQCIFFFIVCTYEFLSFFKLLREAFDREALRTGKPRLLLSAAVPTSKDLVDQAYDITTLARYVFVLYGTQRDRKGVMDFYHHSLLKQH